MKNCRKNAQKSSNGITLIALVITIIVLLILAGISISMLSGDNSILQKATTAKENTERSEIVENAKLDIFAKISEKKGENLTASELEEILTSPNYNTQGFLSDEENILERTLTSKDRKYEIPVLEIYNGTLTNATPSVDTDYSDDVKAKLEIKDNISAYVKYNSILCRVFYDANSPYGIEIISDDVMKTGDNTDMVTLGSGDTNENVKSSDFEITGITATTEINDGKKAAVSYYRAVETLNEKAESYSNKADGIVEYARCVGSNPENPEDTNYFGQNGNPFQGYSEIDVSQINKLSLNETSEIYWLAERGSISYMQKMLAVKNSYYVNNPSDSSWFAQGYVCLLSNSGELNGLSRSFSFRPIFHLAYGVKIKDDGGDGSSTKPFVLE